MADPTPILHCASCRWWRATTTPKDSLYTGAWMFGDCRLHAPVSHRPDDRDFPSTERQDWCGDWETHPQFRDMDNAYQWEIDQGLQDDFKVKP